MTSLDLSTKAGVLRFCELRRAEMVRCFERLGRFEMNEFSFGAYVFATHAIAAPTKPGASPDDWKTGRKLDHVTAETCRLPKVVFDMLPRQKHTELFSYTLRAYAKITRATGTVFMTEMWHATAKERSELPADLEEAPDDVRMEALYMQLEHSATGRRVWVAEIKRNPTRLEPWDERDYGDMSGRMVDLSPWRS